MSNDRLKMLNEVLLLLEEGYKDPKFEDVRDLQREGIDRVRKEIKSLDKEE